MYSLEDSPTFLSQDKVYPYIQLNLKFTAHAAAAKKAADTGDDKQSGTAPQASKAVTLAAPSHSRLFRAMADAAPSGGSPDAAPSGGSPAVTRAHVGTADPRIQVLVLAATTLDSLGHPVAGDKMLRDFCCTETLFQQHIDGCDEVGSLIIKGDSANYKVMDAFFRPAHPMSAELVGLDGRFDVKTTSEHILIIANCDSRLSEYVTEVSGMGEWMNPYGYLPGRLFGFLPFYFGMVIVYAALTTLWALLCLLHRKEIAGIQHIISSALVLTLIEVVCWFMDYNSFNKSGERDMSGVIAAIVFTVLRLTISRMLVVAVSIGFPVVRPNLAVGTQVKIGLLGFIYFLSEASLEVVTRYSQTNETAEHWRLFLSLPVAVLNAIFYWWIFTALHDLLAYLEQQNQVIKLQMYKTFTNMLAGSLFAAVVFALYQMSETHTATAAMEHARSSNAAVVVGVCLRADSVCCCACVLCVQLLYGDGSACSSLEFAVAVGRRFPAVAVHCDLRVHGVAVASELRFSSLRVRGAEPGGRRRRRHADRRTGRRGRVPQRRGGDERGGHTRRKRKQGHAGTAGAHHTGQRKVHGGGGRGRGGSTSAGPEGLTRGHAQQHSHGLLSQLVASARSLATADCISILSVRFAQHKQHHSRYNWPPPQHARLRKSSSPAMLIAMAHARGSRYRFELVSV